MLALNPLSCLPSLVITSSLQLSLQRERENMNENENPASTGFSEAGGSL